MLLSLPIISNGKQIREKTILRYINRYSDQALNYLVQKVGEQEIKEKIDGFDIDEYREDFKQWLISLNKKS